MKRIALGMIFVALSLGACSSGDNVVQGVFRANGESSPSFTLTIAPPEVYEVTLFSDKSGAEYRAKLFPGETVIFTGAPALDSGVLSLSRMGELEEVPIGLMPEGRVHLDVDPVDGRNGLDYSS